MKRFLKIVLIFIGAIFLGIVALICIGLFVDFEYDNRVEAGRYIYLPEDEYKDNEYVEFTMDDYDKNASELIYYDSMEEAILNSPLKSENEDLSVPEDFLNHVDETLHIWQGEQYDTIFYRAGTNESPVQGLVFARCKKQMQDEHIQYAFITSTQVTAKLDSVYGSEFEDFIHATLTLSDFQQDLNPNYPNTRFVFGYAHEKEIYTLEVEGQKPDGIIEIDEYGKIVYMWYYNDLKSDKRGDCLSYSVDMPN